MKKTLYFTRGNPTPEQVAEAVFMGALLRDVNAYHEGDFIEVCDSVAGEYPNSYAHLAPPPSEGSNNRKAQSKK